MIDAIVTNLKTLTATQLGADYMELGHLLDLQKNAFKKSAKRYGIRPLGSTEGPGVTSYHTHDHQVEIVLTDWYENPMVSDSDQRTKGIALQVKHLALYTEIIKQKAGTPASVMLVSDLSVSEPEYIEGENVVAVRATITIRYRQSLN